MGTCSDATSAIDPAEPRARKRHRLQLLNAQFLDHFGLVALFASGINFQFDFSARRFLPLFAHVEQDFVPAGSLGNQSAEADNGLRGKGCRQQNAEQDDTDHQKHGSAIVRGITSIKASHQLSRSI